MAKDKSTRWNTQRKRATKLAGMTVSVASKYAKTRITSAISGAFSDKESKQQKKSEAMSELYTDLGQQIVSTLGELKGAAMKVGQMISQMQHLFPEEFSEVLAQLQNQAPPMDYSVIERQIILELGDYPEKLFQEFDKTPFAAASIGQVHKALTHDGQQVVVKVQYPGIEKACESDLKHLRRLLRLGGLVKIDPDALKAVFDELANTLLDELDYTKEAEQLKAFHAFHQPDDGIVIPQVLTEYSSRAILTTTYETGISIKEAKKTFNQETLDLIGQRMFDFIGRQVFQGPGFHSDPHPGNFAFKDDGTVIVYDFGSVTLLPERIRLAYRDVLEASLNFDYAALDAHLKILEVRNQLDKEISNEFYEFWIRCFLKPFLAPHSSPEHPFNFATSDIHIDAVKHWKNILPYWDAFQPSGHTVFINRVISGIYLILVELGCQGSYAESLAELLDGEIGYNAS